MSLDPDVILDRRRLKRRVTFWRTAAIVIAAVLVYAAVAARFAPPWRGDHVARIDVAGIILPDEGLIEAIRAAAEDRRAKALIVRIDSPGGTTYGGELLYLALREAAEAKPVVAVVETVAASAGYLLALASDRIFIRKTSLTGSIGVLLETAEVSGLLDKIGVTTETVKSGRYKDTPSPFKPMSDADRVVIQGVVDDGYAWFVEIFAERRKFEAGEARRLADGRIYTGRQAVAVRLADQIGGEDDARRWLETERGVAPGLPIRDLSQPDDVGGLFEPFSQWARKTLMLERLRLDGLKSLWQPE